LFRLFKAAAGKNRPAATPSHLALGERGERIACDYLARKKGYRVVATNVEVSLGRAADGRRLSGEIDIIAYDGGTLCFVEVKTRTSDAVAAPERNVALAKQRRIARAARRYRQIMKVVDEPYRYDVVTLVKNSNREKLELLRGYFDDRVLQRARFFRDDFR
jgi:putative endonuclease